MCRIYIKKCLWDRSLWGREGEIRPSTALSLSGLCGALKLALDVVELAENGAFVTLLSLQRILGAQRPRSGCDLGNERFSQRGLSSKWHSQPSEQQKIGRAHV